MSSFLDSTFYNVNVFDTVPDLSVGVHRVRLKARLIKSQH